MKFDILVHRKWLYRSRVWGQLLPFLILCTLCFMAFLLLSAFVGSLTNPVFTLQQRDSSNSLNFKHSRLNTLKQNERTVNSRHLTQSQARRNRTELPDDCFHDLLKSVDPTCDLGMFCTQTWRQEDILCHVFLHQAGLVPAPAQCDLPLGFHDAVEEDEENEAQRSEDVESLRHGDKLRVKSFIKENGRFQEINDSDGRNSPFSAQEQMQLQNEAVKGVSRLWARRDHKKQQDNNNAQTIQTSKDKNNNENFESWNLGDHDAGRTDENLKTKHLKGEGDFKVRGKVKVKDVVPRIAYYVLVSESCQEPFSFQFLHYLSVLSVQRYLRPRAIYVLGNCLPIGYWWSRVLSDVRAVRFVHRPRPLITRDGQVKWISHLADVIRLQVLLVNGGVYLDTDMILLRPLDPLLRYPLTMGLVDNNTGMGNALILATRGSLFLRHWYSGYRDFQPFHFHFNGMWAALRQWQGDPGSVHMESKRFYSPNWFEANLLFYSDSYDISQSYALHVWHRHAPVPSTPEQFLKLNTTLGRVFRRVYFGV